MDDIKITSFNLKVIFADDVTITSLIPLRVNRVFQNSDKIQVHNTSTATQISKLWEVGYGLHHQMGLFSFRR